MNKTPNNRAWFLVLPVFILVAFSAIVPIMTVVNYSVQDIFDQNTAYFVGAEWYREMLRSPRLLDSLIRQFGFSFSILAIEVPLGIAIALMMPSKGRMAAVWLIIVAIPLLIPWNVVGTIWQVFSREDIGLFGWAVNAAGIEYNYASSPLAAWFTVVLMDVWHWTSLVVILCYSALTTIPAAHYQAAAIDSAGPWQVFRFIQLPKLYHVLLMAILLRFMDSFMIYTEAFPINAGGPNGATMFLAVDLGEEIKAFNYGPSAAQSVLYFLIVVTVAWTFSKIQGRLDRGDAA